MNWGSIRGEGANAAVKLLQPLGGSVVADQGVKDGEDMAAIVDDALEERTKKRLVNGFAIPFCESGGGDGNVATQLIGGMAAEKEAVKKRGFTLRELEVLQNVFDRVGLRRHRRKSQFTDFGARVNSAGRVRTNI